MSDQFQSSNRFKHVESTYAKSTSSICALSMFHIPKCSRLINFSFNAPVLRHIIRSVRLSGSARCGCRDSWSSACWSLPGRFARANLDEVVFSRTEDRMSVSIYGRTAVGGILDSKQMHSSISRRGHRGKLTWNPIVLSTRMEALELECRRGRNLETQLWPDWPLQAISRRDSRARDVDYGVRCLPPDHSSALKSPPECAWTGRVCSALARRLCRTT